MRSTRLRSEGNGGAIMSFRTFHRLLFESIFAAACLGSDPHLLFARRLRQCRFDSRRGHGRIRRQGHRRDSGPDLRMGQVVGSAVSGADGSFQILTGSRGRFFLVVSATKFRQLETPGFYAGQLDNIERNIVLEPEWVHESIVVTATGTPTPQPQTGAATSVIGPQELELSQDLVSSLRLMPGTFVVQAGSAVRRVRCSCAAAIRTTTWCRWMA